MIVVLRLIVILYYKVPLISLLSGSSLSLLNHGRDVALHRVEQRERQRHVQHHAGKAGANARVEAHEALSLVNLGEAVSEPSVLVGVDALHLGLDHVDGVVEQGGGGSGNGARHQVDNNLGLDELAQGVLGFVKHYEPHSLVGRLLQESRKQAFVQARGSVLGGDGVDAVEQVAVLGC